jgi:hypothetical protein
MHKFLEGQDFKNCTKSQKVNFFGMETKFVCRSESLRNPGLIKQVKYAWSIYKHPAYIFLRPIYL